MTSDELFALCLEFTLAEEGGDKITEDDGGVTKWGIASRYHPGVDVASLTRDAASAIYKHDYWDRLHCSHYHPPMALVAFDTGVNLGPTQTVLCIQSAFGLREDSILGLATIRAAETALTSGAFRVLERRLSYYDQRVAMAPRKRQWIKGWRLRVLRCAIRAKELGDLGR
jgi:lysozyme family protein